MSAASTSAAFSDTRKLKTYGRQRVALVGISHRDWRAAVSGGSGEGATSGNTYVPPSARITPVVAVGLAGRGLAAVNNKQRRRPPLQLSSDEESAGEEDGDETTGSIDASGSSFAGSVVSSSSCSSPSSDDALPQPPAPNRNGLRRALVGDTPPESPSDVMLVSGPTTSANDTFAAARNAHPNPLQRKDSNTPAKHTQSTADKAREGCVASKAAATAAKVTTSTAAPARGWPFKGPSSTTSDEGKNKENVPLPYLPTKAVARTQQQSSARSGALSSSSSSVIRSDASTSRLGVYLTQAYLSPRPATLGREAILKSHRSSISSSHASSRSTSSSSSSKMHVAPPRGHGANASAAWRRPLTPTVLAGRSSQAHAKQQHRLDALKHTTGYSNRPQQRIVELYKPAEPVSPSLPRAGAKPKAIVKQQALPSRSEPVLIVDDSDSDGLDELSDEEGVVEGVTAAVEKLRIASPRIAPKAAAAPLHRDLQSLLDTCSGDAPPSSRLGRVQNFEQLVESFPLFENDAITAKWAKLGEATYSEVFVCHNLATISDNRLHQGVVAKVLPLETPSYDEDDALDPWRRANGSDTSSLSSLSSLSTSSNAVANPSSIPFTSLPSDVEREIRITRLLADHQLKDDRDGFAHLRGAFLVRGAYPPALLEAWDNFKETRPEACENIRPDNFRNDQMYAVICLSHGGTDLETAKVRRWTDAASILWQVAQSLSSAESAVNFEHRDLHWGNILVRPSTAAHAYDGNVVPACLQGIKPNLETTIIDFTLSRAILKDGTVLFDPFDESILSGQGDYQFDCYRLMETLVKGSWNSTCLATNVVWLHYLACKLIRDKKLKKPSAKSIATVIAASGRGTPRRARGGRSGATAVSSPIRSKVARSNDEKQVLMAEKNAYNALIEAERILGSAVQSAASAARQSQAADIRNRRNKPLQNILERGQNDGVQLTSAGDFVAWWMCEPL